MMVGILSNFNDIYSNLAFEEYLLKYRNDEVFMIWKSEASVVVGKHQNAFSEFNYLYAREKKIPVARRISGGGTVVHGPGNVNFSFIMNGEAGRLIDFPRYIRPVMEFLESLGLKPEIGARNAVFVNGLKISGNAEHIYKNRVLHHGTLLFDADLEMINAFIDTGPEKYTDKAIKSCRSEIGNICNFISPKIAFDEFSGNLFKFLLEYFKAVQMEALSDTDRKEIIKLREEKYLKTSWIFGYSPEFSFEREHAFGNFSFSIRVIVKKGIISSVEVSPENENYNELFVQLKDTFYEYTAIQNKMEKMDLLTPSQIQIFLEKIFG